ncbi:MAG: addiction module protein [Planctomycetota bacterium]
MQMNLDQFGINLLGPAERLELIGLIWDSIPEPEGVALPEWHLRELERRVAAADANPERGVPLESVRSRLLGES